MHKNKYSKTKIYKSFKMNIHLEKIYYLIAHCDTHYKPIFFLNYGFKKIVLFFIYLKYFKHNFI